MFCDECGQQSYCTSDIHVRKVDIRGTTIPVRYQATICGHCGAELFDEEVEDYIMRIAREQYRGKKNMLPASRLKAYMQKNGLSAEQMAEKAGCAVAEIVAASRGVLLDPNVDSKLKQTISA